MVELVEPVVPALLLAVDPLGLPIPAGELDDGELDELLESGVLAEALADGEPDGGDADALAELDCDLSSDDEVVELDELDGDDGAMLVELDGDDGAMLVELDELDGDDGVVVEALDEVDGDDGVVVEALDELDGGLDGVVVVVAVLEERSRSTVRSQAVTASALAIAREINIGLFIAILLSGMGVRRGASDGPIGFDSRVTTEERQAARRPLSWWGDRTTLSPVRAHQRWRRGPR